ncbi:hypothetical protein MXE27_11810, partial [Methanobacterium alcaliphilum]
APDRRGHLVPDQGPALADPLLSGPDQYRRAKAAAGRAVCAPSGQSAGAQRFGPCHRQPAVGAGRRAQGVAALAGQGAGT